MAKFCLPVSINSSVCFVRVIAPLLLFTIIHSIGPNYLDGRSGTSCVDLGAGGGKLALQIFLQCPNMKRVSGIELAPNRVNMGVNIAKRVFAKRNATAKELYSFVTKDPDPELLLASVPKAGEVSLVVLEGDEKRKTRSSGPRSFYLRQGDLFTATEVTTADIVICETNFDHAMHPKLRSLFNQMKHGARLMTYKDLHSVYDVLKPHPIPGFQVLNDGDDRFLTSWSIVNGHHFYVYKRTSCT